MKKVIAYIILGIIVAGLLALNIWLSTYCWNLHYTMYLNEFNAQISTLGFYKEDVHILNQVNDKIKLGWCLAANVVNYIIIVCGALFAGYIIDDLIW